MIVSMKRISLLTLLVGLLSLALSASPASAWVTPNVEYPGLQKRTFKQGPLIVDPGQNILKWDYVKDRPRQTGYITRFSYDLVYADTGKPVPSSVLHLHHAGWLIGKYPAFPAGVEQTIFQFPRGFGFLVRGHESWGMNYMIHNLTARPARVFIRWHMDYLPESAPAAKSMRTLRMHWANVVRVTLYPVFDALRGRGTNGRVTVPDQLTPAQLDDYGRDYRWKVVRDVTLVHASAHMHPGGLYSDLWVRRNGQVKRLFRSSAKYFDPRGPISWNMTQTVTPANWRIKLRKDDVVFMSTTVDTSKASWRESMGIYPILSYNGHDAGGVDPFEKGASWPKTGKITHGPLPAERSSGGHPSDLPDPRSLPSGPQLASPVAIKGFRYQFGDLGNPDVTSRPPVVPRGQKLTFVNLDSKSFVMHTITACKAPCTASTGTSYPLENAPPRTAFDSGQLGHRTFKNFPSAAGRTTWSTPSDLQQGTYTFFCRLHPFMRGSFRVADAPTPPSWSANWAALPQS